MRQPVIDTLRLSDTLRKAGLEREQAEGVARAFGKEFGEHVAVQSDLDAGFGGVRSEMRLMRSELEARIEGVRSEMALMRSELEARIEEVRSSLDAKIEGVRSDLKALNAKFNFGFGLLAALLVAIIGILLGPAGRTRCDRADATRHDQLPGDDSVCAHRGAHAGCCADGLHSHPGSGYRFRRGRR